MWFGFVSVPHAVLPFVEQPGNIEFSQVFLIVVVEVELRSVEQDGPPFFRPILTDYFASDGVGEAVAMAALKAPVVGDNGDEFSIRRGQESSKCTLSLG